MREAIRVGAGRKTKVATLVFSLGWLALVAGPLLARSDSAESALTYRPLSGSAGLPAIDFQEHLRQRAAASEATDVDLAEPSGPVGQQLEPRANGLDLEGAVSAEWGPPGVRILAERIVNSRTGGTSGTLRLELWASTDFPVSGTNITRHVLGGYTVGQIQGGFVFTNVDSGLQPYTAPPSGCYWLTVALLEFDGSVYNYQDLATFDDRFVFGGGSCSLPPSQCASDSDTLCLNGNRFQVEVDWRKPNGETGNGQAVKLTNDTGYLWFFNAENVEVVVKVLNACTGSSGRYWVFAGGLTNVRVDLRVTDTQNGVQLTYVNPLNTAFQPIQDTNAFATCP